MQRATPKARLAQLEKRFWNPPGDPQEWIQLLSELKVFLESGIEVNDAEFREQIVGAVDAFLYSLSRRIMSVDPIFGSITPWIDFIEKSFGELGLGGIESEYIATPRVTYAYLCR
jgi:hypothetical protein